MHAVRAGVAYDGERFLAGGATVVVDGARIVGVEPAACELPDGVPVTAYEGTLLPGLVDAHVHLVADGTPGSLERAGGLDDEALDAVIDRTLRMHVTAGVTTVRDLGDASYRTLHHRDAAADGLPRIVAAGPPITIPDGHCHYLGGVVDGVPAIRDAVAQRAERGVDVVKVMASGGFLTPGSDQLGAQFTADELRALVEAAHGADLRVLAHGHSLIAIECAVDAGVDGLEHFTALTVEGIRTPEELLERVAASGTTVDPTVGYDAARLPSPDQAPPPIRALIDRLHLTPESMRRDRARQLERLRAHGIRVVSGLDAGVAKAKQHGNVWRSVATLYDAGYPVAEALATATSVAADDCGVPAGRLRAGFDADLLVVDGDVRADPDALGRPVAVVVRGVSVG